MTTFAEHPFHLPDKGPLPGLPQGLRDPRIMKALVAFYDEIVNRAQDVASTIGMELATEGVTYDLSRDEVEMFQMGASLAVTVMAEILDKHGLLNPGPWAAYVQSLAQ